MPTPNDFVPVVAYGIITTTAPARMVPQCPDAADESLPASYSHNHAESWGRTTSPSTAATDAGEGNSSEDDVYADGMSSGDDHGTPATVTDDELNLNKLSASTSDTETDEPAMLMSSPVTDVASKQNLAPRSMHTSPQVMNDISSSPYSRTSSMAYEYSSIRLLPSTTSSFLRPGSRFVGTQQSDKSTYQVDVVIKHVDMRESFLCGYLCIQNLTPENPELTTYFEGEMIGNKYAFQTRKKEWGATEKVDCQHWARFSAYRPYSKAARKHDYQFKNFDQKEHIFMRWKECFLVPEHSEKELSGASYEGFYYICFSQVTGAVMGYYFHTNSEKWQQLDLQHVPDRGCYSAIEFR